MLRFLLWDEDGRREKTNPRKLLGRYARQSSMKNVFGGLNVPSGSEAELALAKRRAPLGGGGPLAAG